MENRFWYCRECPFFKSGHCNLTLLGVNSDDICYFMTIGNDLSKKQSAKIISYFQKWRRGGRGLQPNSTLLGMALDEAIKSLRKELK